MMLMRLLKNKIRSKRGETLTETLVSLLIIVPAMVMLAGAIVTAARINHDARDSEASNIPSFSATTGDSGSIGISGSVILDDDDGSITWCNEDDSVYYYFR